MNDSVSQFLNLLRSLPLSKKISIAFALVLLTAGFLIMFIWGGRVDYHVLFNNLSPDDAGAIVSKLKENKIPYKIEGNGSMILVPAEEVHDIRLTLAADGLPKDGNVGFEIFDKRDFRTTRFVQQLNYRRALQGELARTINRFKEVRSSRVFIVLPKESLFIEEKKPASASIQLDLRSSLPPSKLAAVVHLIASAVEGLDAEHVTVVDTKGRLIFRGGEGDQASALLSNVQLDYKRKIENEIRKNVQSMLEAIVGAGKAIVRVNAEIDFNRITLNEEEYDPFATVIRSKRDIEESTETGRGSINQGITNLRSGVIPSQTGTGNTKKRRDITTNYEINKVTRAIFKPAGTIKRLSVAAVIDGTYKLEKAKDGSLKKSYIPRGEKELNEFKEIIKRAMGFNEDREDQVSVSSIPFSDATPVEKETETEAGKRDILKILGAYRTTVINLILVIAVFFLIVKPLLKSMKNLTRETGLKSRTPPSIEEGYTQIPEQGTMRQRERVLELSKSNPEKAEQLIKGWIEE